LIIPGAVEITALSAAIKINEQTNGEIPVVSPPFFRVDRRQTCFDHGRFKDDT